MDIKTISVALVAVMVGAVMFGALIPTFQSIADNAGEPITKTNVGTSHTFREMVPGDELRVDSVWVNGIKTDTWTLNGETVLNEGITSLEWDWALISDAYFLQSFASNNSSVGAYGAIVAEPGATQYLGGAVESSPNRSYIWVMNDDKSITYHRDYAGDIGTPVTYNSTWAYVASTIEDGAYMSAQVTTNPYFAKQGDKNIILAGNYTTGELDTGYYYSKNGVLTLLNSSYTGTVNFEQSLSRGTTDIYDTLVTVSVTDGTINEQFSPYRALVPYEVTGHASSGSVYEVFTILPLVVAVGLLLGTIGFFVSRRF